MSKFWGGSSSEEEPSDDQESSSEEVENAKKSQWMMDSDSDDDNVKRVVKSKDQKQKEELGAAANKLKASLKASEWGAVQKGSGDLTPEFVELNKALAKSKELVQKAGVPAFYIGCLVPLLPDARCSLKTLWRLSAKTRTPSRSLAR
jgi:hypothetical protein